MIPKSNVLCPQCGLHMDLVLLTHYADMKNGGQFVEACYACTQHDETGVPMKVLSFELDEVRETTLTGPIQPLDSEAAPVSDDDQREPVMCIPNHHLMEAFIPMLMQSQMQRDPEIHKKGLDRLISKGGCSGCEEEGTYQKEEPSAKKPIRQMDGFA